MLHKVEKRDFNPHLKLKRFFAWIVVIWGGLVIFNNLANILLFLIEGGSNQVLMSLMGQNIWTIIYAFFIYKVLPVALGKTV